MSLLLTLGDTTPNPRTLFANNEQGLALDVEAAYLRGWVYQDSAGATVAAAAGDPVGLILDTAKGGLDQLGSELVTNGNFSNGQTGWTDSPAAPTGWSFTGGVATGSSANGGYQQTGQFTAGKAYLCTIDLTVSGGAVSFAIEGAGTGPIFNVSGSYRVIIIAASSGSIGFIRRSSSFTGTIDNISVREIPGNHAYQTTSGSRPLLARTPDGGRRNLLTQTESLTTNPPWVPIGEGTGVAPTVTAGQTAPDGTSTAFRLVLNRGAGTTTSDRSSIQFSFTNLALSAHTASVYVKPLDGTTEAQLAGLSNFNVIAAGGSITGVTVTAQADGWFLMTSNATPTSSSGTYRLQLLGTQQATFDCLIWHPQVELGSSRTAYQKVGLTSDVTESGKRDCWGLLFDGSDDFLQTASIDFSATDKMTVMAGVRKLSDAGNVPIELSTNSNSNNGVFAIFGGELATASGAYWTGISKGTVRSFVESTNVFASPVTTVLSLSANITADSIIFRSNGSQIGTSSGDQGSGNFGSYPLYIGRRGGSSLPFNGLLYTLIIRGATTPTATIADFEKLLARRCGVTF